MTNTNAVHFIKSNNLIGIKAGHDRETFLEIWMVVVDNRIFARSWGFAERSWYNQFLKNSLGEIQCGDEVFQIKAQIPEDEEKLRTKINEAYLEKYTKTEHNRKYATGIVKTEHAEKTMEFIVL